MRFGPFIAQSTKIGSGHFGTVLPGVHQRTGQRVAVKIEAAEAVASTTPPRLAREAEVYRALDGTSARFPRLLWFGRAHGHVALVLDRLGSSVREVHRAAGLRLGVSEVQHVGRETLLGLESLHNVGFLHCDVKPANILLPDDGGESADDGAAEALAALVRRAPLMSLVDFGLARRWADESRAAPSRRRSVVGTGRFASLTNHLAVEPLGPRDDVEAALLSLVHLRLGRLPWSGLSAPTKRERFARMLECKRATSVAEVCDGMPHGFEAALVAVRALAHDARPDYGALRRLLGAHPPTTAAATAAPKTPKPRVRKKRPLAAA